LTRAATGSASRSARATTTPAPKHARPPRVDGRLRAEVAAAVRAQEFRDHRPHLWLRHPRRGPLRARRPRCDGLPARGAPLRVHDAEGVVPGGRARARAAHREPRQRHPSTPRSGPRRPGGSRADRRRHPAAPRPAVPPRAGTRRCRRRPRSRRVPARRNAGQAPTPPPPPRPAQAPADAEEAPARGEPQPAAMQDDPAPEPAVPESERIELTIEAVRAYEPNLGSREGAGREPAAPFVPATPPDAPPSNAPRL